VVQRDDNELKTKQKVMGEVDAVTILCPKNLG
jgi:hypothetical protein